MSSDNSIGMHRSSTFVDLGTCSILDSKGNQIYQESNQSFEELILFDNVIALKEIDQGFDKNILEMQIGQKNTEKINRVVNPLFSILTDPREVFSDLTFTVISRKETQKEFLEQTREPLSSHKKDNSSELCQHPLFEAWNGFNQLSSEQGQEQRTLKAKIRQMIKTLTFDDAAKIIQTFEKSQNVEFIAFVSSNMTYKFQDFSALVQNTPTSIPWNKVLNALFKNNKIDLENDRFENGFLVTFTENSHIDTKALNVILDLLLILRSNPETPLHLSIRINARIRNNDTFDGISKNNFFCLTSVLGKHINAISFADHEVFKFVTENRLIDKHLKETNALNMNSKFNY
jgi:hypothetical protein